MKKIIIAILFINLLTGCATTSSDVIQIGKNTYTLSVGHTGLGSGLTSHAELRTEGIKKAAAYCNSKNQELHLDSTQSNGVAGWGSIDDTINFMCFATDDPKNSEVQLRPNPNTVIKVEK